MKKINQASILAALVSGALLLAACGPTKPGDYYPEDGMGDNDSTMRTEGEADEGGLFTGSDGSWFGSKEKAQKAPALGVNSFLWRATLDTLSFMPLASADPTGGVIITDWHANPKVPGERFKLTVYILDTRLRADGVKVSVFRQEQNGSDWRDATVNKTTAVQLENQILRKARELKVSTGGE